MARHPGRDEMTGNNLLSNLCGLARDAGAAIMKIYATEFVAEYKDDRSPVTEADTAAEKIILAGLRDFTPNIPIVAEESYAAGDVPDVSGGSFWLVDPLDGTREFLDRNGEFTVNIALIENGEPVCGVVFAPALETLYCGRVGEGAWVEVTDQVQTEIRVRSAPTADLVVVASRRHGDPEKIAKFLEGRRIGETRNAGSSLKFCLIAAGEADIYPRFGRTMEWDTAAGQAVLESAGGRVVTLAGEPFRHGKPDYENPHFIAWGGSI